MKKVLILIIFLLLLGCENNSINENIANESNDIKEVLKEPLDYDFDFAIEAASNISNMRNLSVNIDGVNYVEEYYNNCKEISKNNVFSVTKSVTALLIGIAIDDGYINSVDDLISDYINLEDFDVETRLYDVTIRDVLMMSAGYQWIQSQSNEYQTIKSKMDPLEFIFSKSMNYDPGERFAYSNEEAYIATVILNNAVGMTPLDYGNEKLFGPLGIENVRWSESRTGINYGGFDLHLSCQDMEKIGLLMINYGKYEGEEIISSDYMEEAMAMLTSTGPGNRYDGNYGFYFWTGKEYGYDVISCLGHGGQIIMIVPELKTVMTTSTIGAVSDDLAYEQFLDVEDLLRNQLLTYIIEKQ
jgi:CubicO group peptidase (beta-lactamase class C family)